MHLCFTHPAWSWAGFCLFTPALCVSAVGDAAEMKRPPLPVLVAALVAVSRAAGGSSQARAQLSARPPPPFDFHSRLFGLPAGEYVWLEPLSVVQSAGQLGIR